MFLGIADFGNPRWALKRRRQDGNKPNPSNYSFTPAVWCLAKVETCYLWIRLLAAPIEFLFDDNSESPLAFNQHYRRCYIDCSFGIKPEKHVYGRCFLKSLSTNSPLRRVQSKWYKKGNGRVP